MQERSDIKQSIWLSSGTLLNDSTAKLPIIICTSEDTSGCDWFRFSLSTVLNVSANEEIFFEDSIIIVSTSSSDFRRFLFFISADGTVLVGMMAEAIAFDLLAVFDESDDSAKVFEIKHDSIESTSDVFSSSIVNSEPTSI